MTRIGSITGQPLEGDRVRWHLGWRDGQQKPAEALPAEVMVMVLGSRDGVATVQTCRSIRGDRIARDDRAV